MLDSGAKRSVIRQDLCKNVISNNRNSGNQYLMGLGKKQIKTSGEIDAQINIYGADFKFNGIIVENDKINHGIILGLDFLREHKFKIDMWKRKITITHDDGSTSKVLLSENNEVI